jgi:hypothetical protein
MHVRLYEKIKNHHPTKSENIPVQLTIINQDLGFLWNFLEFLWDFYWIADVVRKSWTSSFLTLVLEKKKCDRPVARGRIFIGPPYWGKIGIEYHPY